MHFTLKLGDIVTYHKHTCYTHKHTHTHIYIYKNLIYIMYVLHIYKQERNGVLRVLKACPVEEGYGQQSPDLLLEQENVPVLIEFSPSNAVFKEKYKRILQNGTKYHNKPSSNLIHLPTYTHC